MYAETTILNFRHRTVWIIKANICRDQTMPWEQGLLLREGTTVNDTLIAASSATKNLRGKRGSGIAVGDNSFG